MRLINTTTYELHYDDMNNFKQEGYAILSHRWIGEEITFDQLPNYIAALRAGINIQSTPQLFKIYGACQIARGGGIKWMWIDSCCIDKKNAVEESESINSMFKWYRNARVCITYLSDVEKRTGTSESSLDIFTSIESGKPSAWFTRGWTLQELLAPREMYFYDKNWECLGQKGTLANEIESITRISAKYITGEEDFRQACIAVKISWMATRKTKRIEDITYSMLGIFDVYMIPQYGEGTRAFTRLQRALLETSTDESLFAWKMPQLGDGLQYTQDTAEWGPDEWGLLAATPEWFKDSEDITIQRTYMNPPVERIEGGFTVEREGIHITTPGVSWNFLTTLVEFTCVGIFPMLYYDHLRQQRPFPLELNCYRKDQFGRVRPIHIYLRPFTGPSGRYLKRIRCNEYGVFGRKISWKPSSIEPTPETILQPAPNRME